MKVVQVTPEQFTKIMWKFGSLVMLIILIIRLPAIIDAIHRF